MFPIHSLQPTDATLHCYDFVFHVTEHLGRVVKNSCFVFVGSRVRILAQELAILTGVTRWILCLPGKRRGSTSNYVMFSFFYILLKSLFSNLS
jgi:hypothetical protein